jgi:hypothetical protein
MLTAAGVKRWYTSDDLFLDKNIIGLKEYELCFFFFRFFFSFFFLFFWQYQFLKKIFENLFWFQKLFFFFDLVFFFSNSLTRTQFSSILAQLVTISNITR